MAALDRLLDLAGRRSEEALRAWQQLRLQCDEMMRKLAQLREFRDRYGSRVRADLASGVGAAATVAYLDFIGRIDEVVARQQHDLGGLEAACAERWQALIEARRERRMYELLGERAAAREAAAQLRRSEKEIDELLQRAAGMG